MRDVYPFAYNSVGWGEGVYHPEDDVGGFVPPGPDALLQEDGFDILQEDSNRILIEFTQPSFVLLEGGSFLLLENNEGLLQLEP